VAAGLLGLIAVGLAVLRFTEKPVVAPETRLDIVTPPTNSPTSFALSPDGRKIAYVATTDGVSRLWVRPLDSISGQALPGTEKAVSPFWSPDSRSLGFFADFKLKRIDLGSGQPQNLAEVVGIVSQGAWGADGTILFNPSPGTPLLRMPAAGGPADAATKLAKGTAGHRSPRFVTVGKTGGKLFLFASLGAAPAIWLGSPIGGSPINPGAAGTEPRRVTASGPVIRRANIWHRDGWLG
jgi:hypothetical protein